MLDDTGWPCSLLGQLLLAATPTQALPPTRTPSPTRALLHARLLAVTGEALVVESLHWVTSYALMLSGSDVNQVRGRKGGGGVVACLHSFLGAHAAGASRVWRGCLVRHQFCVVHPWTKCVINTRARLHARQHVHRCVHANAYTQPCTHPHAQQTHVPPASASLAAVMRALGNLAPCCSMVPCRSKRKMTRSPCSSRCPSKPCRQLLRGRRVRSKRRSWWPSRQ